MDYKTLISEDFKKAARMLKELMDECEKTTVGRTCAGSFDANKQMERKIDPPVGWKEKTEAREWIFKGCPD